MDQEYHEYLSRELQEAAAEGKCGFLQLLIEAGADVNHTSSSGKTALMLASEYGHADCVQALINARAYVNIMTSENHTAVRMAGNLECLKALVAAGADVNIGDTVNLQLDLLTHINYIRVLMDAGSDPDSTFFHEPFLCTAVGAEDVGLVNMLLESGASVNVWNEDDVAPLQVAAYQGMLDIAQKLLSAGADVNILSPFGITPLMYATKQGETTMVNLLIHYGAQVNLCDFEYENTALHLVLPIINKLEPDAVLHITDALIAAGADVNVSNKRGDVPLDHVYKTSRDSSEPVPRNKRVRGVPVWRRCHAGRFPSDWRVVHMLSQ